MNNEQNLGNILESSSVNAIQTNNKVQKLVECVIANHRTTGKLVEYTNRMAYITAKRVDYLENKIERLQKELNETKLKK